MPSLGSGSNAQPFATVQDYENWLKRLDGMVVWMDQAIVNMREGMAQGVVQPRPVMEKVLPQLDAMIVARARGQRVLRAGEARSPRASRAADRERLTAAYTAAIRDEVVPAYRRLRDFVRDEYLPKTAIHGGLERAAGRRGVVRVLRPGAHHHDHDARGDPPARPERGGAHPRRDGQGAADGRLQGRPAGVLHAPRDRPAVLLHRTATTCCRAIASSSCASTRRCRSCSRCSRRPTTRCARSRRSARSRRRARPTRARRPTARGPASSTSTRST